MLSPESIAIICSALGGILTLIFTNYFNNKKLEIAIKEAKTQREQDRLDKEKDRELDRLDREANKNEILNAGDERKNQILGEVKQVKTVAVKSALKSEQAIIAANNVTEKTNIAVDIATKALEKVNRPMQVEVTNTSDHPIPVKQDEHSN